MPHEILLLTLPASFSLLFLFLSLTFDIAKLELFQVHAVTGGADAQATVSVRLSEDGLVATARSSDPDTLTATARAYIHALCKLDIRRAKRIAA